MSALHKAARDGDLAALSELLEGGEALEQKDHLSRTPLHLAAWASQVECIEALIVAGADVKAGAGDDMSPLHFAASKGHTEACRTLLAAGAPINDKTRRGMNALHFAAQQGHLETVEMLVASRASLGARNGKKQTAEQLAKSEEIAKYLAGEWARVQAEKAANSAEGGEGGQGTKPGKGRANVRKRGDAAAAVASDSRVQEAPGEQAQPKPKAQKVALSHLGDEEDDGGGDP